LPGDSPPTKLLASNRQASHNFFLLERFEAGLVLTGTEVKSAREGSVQLKESYAEVRNGEAWLVDAHFSPYSHGNRANHDPLRDRKLLLHRREIDKLLGKTREKGLTLLPIRIYLKEGRIKCELALARAKKLHDKRAAARERATKDEARRALRGRKS
jgi:SsrA-binding protein